MLCLLLLSLVPAQGPSFRASEMRVNPSGAELVFRVRSSSGWREYRPAQGNARQVVAPRWKVDDGGLAWICRSVAAGDSGATVVAGKGLNNEGVALYPSGEGRALFDSSTLGSEDPVVAAADRAPVVAAFTAYDRDPSPTGFDYEGIVTVWDTTGNGAADWSYTFPRTQNYFGGGVAISDDGSTILAWKADPVSGNLLVRTFDRAGNLLASADFNSGGSFNARQTILSDDGNRAYFSIGADAVIYDTHAAVVEFTYTIGASFDSHSLSGNGKRFAYGNFGSFSVWEESSPGIWNQIAQRNFSGSTYVARLALDGDGGRLAYIVQTYSPNYDTLDTGLYDVNAGQDLWTDRLSAPGTTFQLVASGAAIDDAGDSVAFGSWGDSLNATPELLAYDSAGVRTLSVDLPGSVFGIDLDSDGDVAVAGSKAVHANTFGNGGSIVLADPYEQFFHVLGTPRVGSSLRLEVPAPWQVAGFTACRALGSSPSAWGTTELDLNTAVWRSPNYPVPPGGLSVPQTVPGSASIVGRSLHLQGVVGDSSGAQLTNKVSLRILP